ncbi:MAG: hypothetical protein JKY31_06275 [Rhodobacteraceae bacterium]|nr:hypothetical protein [Paracoccaceae bacterium]
MNVSGFNEDQITALFTHDNQYRFARWGREIAPVVFGTDDESLTAIKAAFAQVAGIANMKLAEMDPELGANFLVFFCNDWSEIADVPNLERLMPGLDELSKNLAHAGANQYRHFAFDEHGGIKMCILLIKADAEMMKMSVQTLATDQMARSILLWSENAFLLKSPIGIIEKNNMAMVRPNIAAVIRAAYDKTMPVAATDPTHTLRLASRVMQLLIDGDEDDD